MFKPLQYKTICTSQLQEDLQESPVLEINVQRDAPVFTASSEKEKLDNKINSLYNMFQPLLNNLASNPEKEYIFWPNRLTKIEEFRDKIDAVYKG